MTFREHDLRAHRVKIDEQRQKLKDLSELKRHIHATLDRMSRVEDGDAGAHDGKSAGSVRRDVLCRSLEEIEREVRLTEAQLAASEQAFNEQENARDGYDRVPVAVGSRRGRGQVEHIRIVRAQRE